MIIKINIVGNLNIVDQAIHVGYKVNIPVIEDAKWDGIVGLGFWYNYQTRPEEKDKSILDNIMDHKMLANNVFSYYIPNQNEGRASFGDLMRDVVKNPRDIMYSVIENINEEAQWVIILKDIRFEFRNDNQKVNGQRMIKKPGAKDQQKLQVKTKQDRLNFLQKMLRRDYQQFQQMRQKKSSQNPCFYGCKLLVDTGTYLNYIPQKWFTYFMPKSQFDFDQMLCQYKDSFPDIVLIVKGMNGDYKLSLSPEQYLESYSYDRECTMTWTPDNIEQDTVTLGQAFIKNYYTIFDFNGYNKKIGFYKLR